MVRQRFRTYILVLIAGFLMNIVVAWSLELTRPFRARDYSREVWLADDEAANAGWLWQPSHEWPAPNRWVSSPIRGRRWAASHYTTRERGNIFFMTSTECGWPLLAFRARQAYEAKGSGIRVSDPNLSWFARGLEIPAPGQWDGVASLPLDPVMPGFIVNTIVYTGATWLILFTTRTARRRYRTCRGMCTNCKYPITGHTICPECGHSATGNTAPSHPAGVPVNSQRLC